MPGLPGSVEVALLEALHQATVGQEGHQGYSGTLVGGRPEALVHCADWTPWGGHYEAAAVLT